jgi:hypothetical protein
MSLLCNTCYALRSCAMSKISFVSSITFDSTVQVSSRHTHHMSIDQHQPGVSVTAFRRYMEASDMVVVCTWLLEKCFEHSLLHLLTSDENLRGF